MYTYLNYGSPFDLLFVYFLFLISHVGPPACCCGQCHQIVLIKPRQKGLVLNTALRRPCRYHLLYLRNISGSRTSIRTEICTDKVGNWKKKSTNWRKKRGRGCRWDQPPMSHVCHLAMFCMSVTKILQNQQCQVVLNVYK